MREREGEGVQGLERERERESEGAKERTRKAREQFLLIEKNWSQVTISWSKVCLINTVTRSQVCIAGAVTGGSRDGLQALRVR